MITLGIFTQTGSCSGQKVQNTYWGRPELVASGGNGGKYQPPGICAV
jgi:hypothetical protein